MAKRWRNNVDGVDVEALGPSSIKVHPWCCVRNHESANHSRCSSERCCEDGQAALLSLSKSTVLKVVNSG